MSVMRRGVVRLVVQTDVQTERLTVGRAIDPVPPTRCENKRVNNQAGADACAAKRARRLGNRENLKAHRDARVESQPRSRQRNDGQRDGA